MNTTIFGKRRQGKSTLALALAVAKYRRVIVWDPNDQLPLIKAVDPSELSFSFDPGHSQTGFTFARIGPFNTDEIEERFSEFAEALYQEWEATPGGHMSVIVDESHLLQGPNWIHPELDRMVRRAPGDVHLIQTTHRIVDSTPTNRYHADNVFFFFAGDLEGERKMLARNFGEKTAIIVPTLKPFHALYWKRAPGGRIELEHWNDPAEWYINLGNQNYARE